MKKQILLLIVLCLLLAGCNTAPAETTQPQIVQTTAPQPTETTAPGPGLLELAEPVDDTGTLYRLPETLAGGQRWDSVALFDGKMLFWYVESGDYQAEYIDLWLVEPAYGQTVAENRIPVVEYCMPQIQENRICICDNGGGQVTILNDKLEITDQWQTEPAWNLWFMGSGSTLYQTVDAVSLVALDLETGEKTTVLDRINGIYTSSLEPDGAHLYYTDVDTMQRKVSYLDFELGTITESPLGGAYSEGRHLGETWLCRNYLDSRVYHYGTGEEVFEIRLEGGLLDLTEQGWLLEQHSDGEHLYLYDEAGRFLAGCGLSPEWYIGSLKPTWCEELDGFLFNVFQPDQDGQDLMLWIPGNGTGGGDLWLEPRTPEEITPDNLEELRRRADALGETFGVKIWIGSECRTDFDDFTADQMLDPLWISDQLDILERALGAYPEGFLTQLRYGIYQQIHIHLVGNLVAKPHYGTGGSYGGFVQPQDGYYLMVINTDYAAEGTYYHEFSHIIDDYLEWDSWNREGALYSEDGWMALNPEGFAYTWDYAVTQEFRENWDQYFIDQYAMINATEDRARTLEYGMYSYMQWRFDEMPGVVEKLRWYAMCIRDAFDTTGWPEELLWEQYIP